MKHLVSVGLSVVGVGLTLACGGLDADVASRFDERAQELDQQQGITAPIGSVVEGSAFNAMLPPEGFDGHNRVFTQEREGYSEAAFTKEGQTVTVSISDTRDNPDARQKFSSATETVSGHPVVAHGKHRSVMLVQNRFQVRVSAPHLNHTQRLAWLEAVPASQLADLL